MTSYVVEPAFAGVDLRRSNLRFDTTARLCGTRTIRVIVAALMVLTLWSWPHHDDPALVINGATPTQRVAVEEVMAGYRRAGLDVPPVVLTFGGAGQCGGAEGRHVGLGTIEVCAPGRHVIAHELAHVWLETEMDRRRRHEFLAVRGLTTWNDRSVAWDERGSEQAAEVLTWAVLRHPVLLVRFHGKSCAGLAEGYQTLTGRTPVPSAAHCPVY